MIFRRLAGLRPTRRWLLALPLLAALFAVMVVIANTNLIGPSLRADSTRPITPGDLAPAECASIRALLSVVVVASGNYNDGGANALILHGPPGGNVSGQGGSDCIIVHGGDNDLRGGTGDDVLIGGPGVDRFFGGVGADTCYIQAGEDVSQCETVITR